MGAIGTALTNALTPWALPLTLGATAWQLFNQPDAPNFNMQPQGYSSPQGQNIYNPSTNTTVHIPNFDPQGLSNYWQNQLLRSYAMGGIGGANPYEAWRGNIESEIADLSGKISGAYYEGTPMPFNSWYRRNYGFGGLPGPMGGGNPFSHSGSRPGSGGPGGNASAPAPVDPNSPEVQAAWQEYQATASEPQLRDEILQEQIDAWTQEMGKLEEILKQTGELDWRYGSLLGPSDERLSTFSDMGGTLEEILGRTIEDQRASSLTDLARRGNLGGSAEAAVAGQTARAQLDAKSQRLQFQQSLENMDYNRMIELINYIDSGGRADLAQQQSAASFGNSVTSGMAALEQARMFAEQQAAQWQQGQISNALGAAGNTIGYLMQGQQNPLAQLQQWMMMLNGIGGTNSAQSYAPINSFGGLWNPGAPGAYTNFFGGLR